MNIAIIPCLYENYLYFKYNDSMKYDSIKVLSCA